MFAWIADNIVTIIICIVLIAVIIFFQRPFPMCFAVFSDFVGVFDVLVAIVYRRNFLPFDFFYPRRGRR